MTLLPPSELHLQQHWHYLVPWRSCSHLASSYGQYPETKP